MKDSFGRTPLHVGLWNAAQAASVKLVVQAWPDAANEVDIYGSTPLDSGLAKKASEDTLLVVLNASTQACSVPNKLNKKLPLRIGLEYKAPANAIKAMLQAYPQAAAAISNDGKKNTMLHTALLCKASVTVVKELLDAFPKATTLLNRDGLYPLLLAAQIHEAGGSFFGFEDCVVSLFAKNPEALSSRSDATVASVARAASLPVHGTRKDIVHRLSVVAKLEAPYHPCIFCVAGELHPGDATVLAEGYKTKWSQSMQRHYWSNKAANISTFERPLKKELLHVNLKEAQQKAEADHGRILQLEAKMEKRNEQLGSTRQQLDTVQEELRASIVENRKLLGQVKQLTTITVFNVETGEDEIQQLPIAKVLESRKRQREVVPQKAAEARKEVTKVVKKIKVERDVAAKRAADAEEDVEAEQEERQTMITFSAKQTDAIDRLKVMCKRLGGNPAEVEDAADVLKKR